MVVALVPIGFAFHSKNRWKMFGWIAVSAGIICAGLAPLLVGMYVTYLSTHGVYAVRVVVLGVDGSPVEGSEVVCAPGGEKKRIDGGWECDVAPGSRPADGVFTARVTEKSAFLAGERQLRLAGDYHPVLTVPLQRDTSARLQGGVKGKEGRAFAGAWVWVVGHEAERVQTDAGGGFVLAAHAAPGQMVKLHAEAKGYPVYEGLQQAGDTSISVQLAP